MPEWEYQGWQAFLSKEPTPEERTCYQLAMLSAQFVNSKQGKGKKSKTIREMMVFGDAWDFKPASGNEDVDHDISLLMAAFASRLVIERRQAQE